MEILKIGKSWTGALEHRAKDGHRVFVESRQQIIDSEGGVLILETNHDISQRKRAETYNARMEISHFLLGSRVQTSTGRLGAHGLEPTLISFEGGHRLDREVLERLGGSAN